jgi:hypothetical protein
MEKCVPFQLLGGGESSQRILGLLRDMEGPVERVTLVAKERLSVIVGTSAIDDRVDLLSCLISLLDMYSSSSDIVDIALPESVPAFKNGCHMFFNPIGSEKNGVGVVRVSTVHRAKGVEADDVHLHQMKLLPLPERIAKGGWNADEELCVEFVAKSRARNRMTYHRDLTTFDKASVLALWDPPVSITGDDTQATNTPASEESLGAEDGADKATINNALKILNLTTMPETSSELNKIVRALLFRAHPDHHFNSPESTRYVGHMGGAHGWNTLVWQMGEVHVWGKWGGGG